MASDTASPEDAVWRSEVADGVLRAVHDLPEHLRVAVALRYYADLSEREVAIAIGRRPGTVKSRLHEARRILAAHPGLRALAINDTGATEEAFR